MKPKIITGEETVGYYFSGNKILSKTYNELSEDEQQDYLTEDDDRKYIFIDSHDGSFDSIVEMYYTKEFLIEMHIEGIKESISTHEGLMRNASNYIVKLQNDLTKYEEMLYVVKLGESK